MAIITSMNSNKTTETARLAHILDCHYIEVLATRADDSAFLVLEPYTEKNIYKTREVELAATQAAVNAFLGY